MTSSMTRSPGRPIGSITTTEAPDATIIRVAGDVDSALRGDASRAMATTVRRRLPVVLDAADLTFIDSTGLAFLIQCATAGRDDGVPVELSRPPAHLTELLRDVGAAGIFA